MQKIGPFPGSVTRKALVVSSVPMLFDTSVRAYSGVFGCVHGMYKEYYGLSTEIPNSFISSALYAEKSCHKPEHFSKRDEVFGIL